MATDGRTLTISAYDGDTQKTLELLVNERNHRKLYRECNGDYALLANRLQVERDRLILIDSKTLDAGDHAGSVYNFTSQYGKIRTRYDTLSRSVNIMANSFCIVTSSTNCLMITTGQTTQCRRDGAKTGKTCRHFCKQGWCRWCESPQVTCLLLRFCCPGPSAVSVV